MDVDDDVDVCGCPDRAARRRNCSAYVRMGALDLNQHDGDAIEWTSTNPPHRFHICRHPCARRGESLLLAKHRKLASGLVSEPHSGLVADGTNHVKCLVGSLVVLAHLRDLPNPAHDVGLGVSRVSLPVACGRKRSLLGARRTANSRRRLAYTRGLLGLSRGEAHLTCGAAQLYARLTRGEAQLTYFGMKRKRFVA